MPNDKNPVETEFRIAILRAHLQGKVEAFAEIDSQLGRILTPELGEILRYSGERNLHKMQDMRKKTTRSGLRGDALANVEMDIRALNDGTLQRPRNKRGPKPGRRTNSKRGKTTQGRWWNSLSPEAQQEIIKKRIAGSKATRERKKQEKES